MRTLERSSAFKRDYKRAAKGPHRVALDTDLISVLVALMDDQPLEPRLRDHDLSGDWAGCREWHVKLDLRSIYRKPDADTLRLTRFGAHCDSSADVFCGRVPASRVPWDLGAKEPRIRETLMANGVQHR